MNLKLITKLIGSLSFKDFLDLLLKNIQRSFTNSFNNTNKSFKWESKANPEVLNYLKNRQIILSEKTQARLHGNLSMELLEGIENKESITELIKRINPLFDNMQRFELERIVRTESLHAMNAGTLHSFEKSGVVQFKVWKANINNKRTAEDSKRLHNQVQLLKDPFIDPKTGDTCDHPPNRPQCRCYIIGLAKLPKNIKKKNGLMYLVE